MPTPSLDPPIGPYDHLEGVLGAPHSLVEYGDFECPYCRSAAPVVAEVRRTMGDALVFAFRHFPLAEVHPHALAAALAAEAAGAQGRFWEMHDLLLDHQDRLRATDLLRYAGQLGLDVDRFHDALRTHEHARRVATDIESADLSGVSGTPTFFVNGRRHYGAYDIAGLTAAIKVARARARTSARARP